MIEPESDVKFQNELRHFKTMPLFVSTNDLGEFGISYKKPPITGFDIKKNI